MPQNMTAAKRFIVFNANKGVVTMFKKINYAERQAELKRDLAVRNREEKSREKRAESRAKKYDFEEVSLSQDLSELLEINRIHRFFEKNKTMVDTYVGEEFIQRNVKLERLGLSVICYEYLTNAGYIDILCKDKSGTSVVVEVKQGIASDSAVGQVLGYMNALTENCNGIILAEGFTKRVRYAVKNLNIGLVQYIIKCDGIYLI